jgi:hypothetical protein
MMPLSSIGTWDMEKQAYTPQAGVEKSFNLTAGELRAAMKRLRELGYSVHRRGNVRDGHDDNDCYVLIERTDGKPEAEILEGWKR